MDAFDLLALVLVIAFLVFVAINLLKVFNNNEN